MTAPVHDCTNGRQHYGPGGTTIAQCIAWASQRALRGHRYAHRHQQRQCGAYAPLPWAYARDEFAPADQRWEALFARTAPPTEVGTRGQPRLPTGWVADPALALPSTVQLRALGNGVVLPGAAVAVRHLLADASEIGAGGAMALISEPVPSWLNHRHGKDARGLALPCGTCLSQASTARPSARSQGARVHASVQRRAMPTACRGTEHATSVWAGGAG